MNGCALQNCLLAWRREMTVMTMRVVKEFIVSFALGFSSL